MRIIMLVSLWCLLAILPRPSPAKTIQVAAGGNIDAGLRQMAGGDTLLLASGTYTEKPDVCLMPSGTTSQPTVIKADTPYGAVLTLAAVSDHIFDFGKPCAPTNLIIDGLIIDQQNRTSAVGWVFTTPPLMNLTIQHGGCRNLRSQSLCFVGGGKGIVLKNNIIENIGMDDPVGGTPCPTCFSYGHYLASSDTVIEGNRYSNIGAYAIHGYNGHGDPVSNNIIRYNVFCNVGTILIGCQGTGNQVTDNWLYQVGQTKYPYEHTAIRACNPNQIIRNNQTVTTASICDSQTLVGTGRPPPTGVRLLTQ